MWDYDTFGKISSDNCTTCHEVRALRQRVFSNLLKPPSRLNIQVLTESRTYARSSNRRVKDLTFGERPCPNGTQPHSTWAPAARLCCSPQVCTQNQVLSELLHQRRPLDHFFLNNESPSTSACLLVMTSHICLTCTEQTDVCTGTL